MNKVQQNSHSVSISLELHARMYIHLILFTMKFQRFIFHNWNFLLLLENFKRFLNDAYLTKLVIARISGSFLYGFASCESNGLMPDFINILANTRYLRHVVLLKRYLENILWSVNLTQFTTLYRFHNWHKHVQKNLQDFSLGWNASNVDEVLDYCKLLFLLIF